MSTSLNRVQLIGHIGKTPETRITNSNMPITNFSIATTFNYKKNDEWHNKTTWHNITCFNMPDYLLKQAVKGARVFLEGRIDRNEYTDKEGNKRYSYAIIMEKLIPLTAKSKDGEETEPEESYKPETNADNSDFDDLPF